MSMPRKCNNNPIPIQYSVNVSISSILVVFQFSHRIQTFQTAVSELCASVC